MTPDVLDRVRASNPLPDGSTAPELEPLLARLQAAGPRARLRPSRLVPVLGVGVAVLVLIGALGVLHPSHRPGGRGTRVSAPPPKVPLAPTGGMRGLVLMVGAGFSPPSQGVISLQQCVGCLANGNQTAHSRDRYWLARTVDGGRSWSLIKEHYAIQAPLFVGRSGWAGGLKAEGPQAGGVAEYYVTHDGGRSWNVAPAAAPNQGGALVSVSGGEVWATGLVPNAVTIMHAPVTGSRLRATASQPIHGGSTNVQVIAAGRGTAYVSNADARRQTFVTHDDGQSWQRIRPPCSSGESGGLNTAHGDTVWAECYSPVNPRPVLALSEDGGRSWQRISRSVALTSAPQLVSSETAWALSGRKVLRTTDGGLTWSAVWSAATSQPPALRSKTPPPIAAGPDLLLVAQSPTSASVVTAITGGGTRTGAKLTNLVVYRTTDGGRTWQPSVVPLGMRKTPS